MPVLTIPSETRREDVRTRPLRLGLFGGPLDTGNHGVTALGLATVGGLADRGVPVEVTIFDSTPGRREARVPAGGGEVTVRLVGCFHSRRYYRRDNLAQIHVAARLGLKGHPLVGMLEDLDAVLDISGGDAFSDLYGMREFRGQCLPKLVALALGKPLVLLPQTYGPYRRQRARAAARAILTRAAQVWARESRGQRVACWLLEDREARKRVRLGVDVAFGLPARRPSEAIARHVLAVRADADVLVGLNVSGLLYNRPGEERRRFGYRASYRDLMHALVTALGRRRGLRVLLVPHVVPEQATFDRDDDACAALVGRAPSWLRDRLCILPPGLGPAETKWAVGRCDWFCGARMHACIAALSQGVPTAGIAYSDKIAGVCDDLGVPDGVVDPRRVTTRGALRELLESLDRRETFASALQERLPVVRERLDRQFRVMLAEITSGD